jgi:hypothetical protein
MLQQSPIPMDPAEYDALYDETRAIVARDKPLPSVPIASFQTRSPFGRRSLIDASESPKALSRPISPSPVPKRATVQPALVQPSPENAQNSPQAPSHAAGIDCTDDKYGAGSEGACCHHLRNCQCGLLNKTALKEIAQGLPQAETSPAGHSTPGEAEPASNTAVEDSRLSGLDFCSSARGSLNLEDINEDFTCTDNSYQSDPTHGTVATKKTLTSNGRLSSPAPQPRPTIQTPPGILASRLPRRKSTVGPVRGAGSPRSFMLERSSPYGQVRTPMGQGFPTHQECSTTLRRISTFNRSLGAPCSANDPIAEGDRLSLNHTSRQKRVSSIPRPRYLIQSRQDHNIRFAKTSLRQKSPTPESSTQSADDNVEEKKITASTKNDPAMLGPGFLADKIGESTNPDEPSPSERKEKLRSSSSEEGPLSNQNASVPTASHQHAKSSPHENNAKPPSPSTSRPNREQSSASCSRVKRLSTAAPEYGPVLRISGSAEKIIMGDEFERDLNIQVGPGHQHRSVPDLRRSLVIKELCRSTEGILNGISPLTRSLTSRSLNQTDKPSRLSGLRDLKLKSHSEADSRPLKADSHLARGRSEKSVKHGASSKASLSRSRNRTPIVTRQAVGHPGLENCMSPEGSSWIPPLPPPPTKTAFWQGSTFYENEKDQEGANGLAESLESASEAPASRDEYESDLGPSSDPNTVNTWLMDKTTSPPVTSHNTLVFREDSRFPLRVSSRANTPDLAEVRALVDQRSSALEIPTRFVSSRRKEISGATPLPQHIAVDSGPMHSPLNTAMERPGITAAPPSHIGRAQPPNAKRVFSSFKGFFHRRQVDSLATSTTPSASLGRLCAPQDRIPTMVSSSGSPYPSGRSRTLPRSDGIDSGPQLGWSPGATPYNMHRGPASDKGYTPLMETDQFGPATALVAQILDAAQQEVDPPEKAKLLLASLALSFGGFDILIYLCSVAS